MKNISINFQKYESCFKDFISVKSVVNGNYHNSIFQNKMIYIGAKECYKILNFDSVGATKKK